MPTVVILNFNGCTKRFLYGYVSIPFEEICQTFSIRLKFSHGLKDRFFRSGGRDDPIRVQRLLSSVDDLVL